MLARSPCWFACASSGLNLFWKVSPAIWMLFLLVALFIPLQWGAPAGPINVYQPIVEVIPNVSGEVVEVGAKGNVPIAKDDLLFRIDPQPFQLEVDRLAAALKEAEQAAEMLPADLSAAKAAVTQARAAVKAAKQEAESLEAGLDAAKAAVFKFESQVLLAKANFDRAQKLVKDDALSELKFEQEKRNWDAANASLKEAQAQLKKAQLATESQLEGVNTGIIQADQALEAARAQEAKAQLALDSVVNGENTTVAQLRAQLAQAQYDLDKTTVRAPSDGFVYGATLRPGQRVTAMPMRSWMAFIDTENTTLAMSIEQYAIRHVEPGQKAEVVFKVRPGKTFGATVWKIARVNPEAQLQPSGVVASGPQGGAPLSYLVLLKLDDADLDVRSLPGGAAGQAAIYTDSARAAHVIRKVMMRMSSWMNYVLPW